MIEQNESRIEFVDRILDNVHGFIEYTEYERKIINLLLFRRLQSIKQLSLVNWVFPGSEHTRFIHSIGVMHIADKIAVRLGYGIDDRKIIRMAGLLHDIGHYPLSHVCEASYQETVILPQFDNLCEQINNNTKNEIDNLRAKTKLDLMKKSSGFHHESIGENIIRSDTKIKEIIIEACSEDAIDTICDMITGNVERESTDPAMVQLLHSEFDADGIDYMMRDSMFSGTSFGSFELDLLINSMSKVEHKGKNIICISSKGIAAADQYLINKFFSYAQVVCNKHTLILEWMAQSLVEWMRQLNAYFPSGEEFLSQWVKKENPTSTYLSFNDNFFWKALQDLSDNQLTKAIPQDILRLANKLLNHKELPYIEDSEVRIQSIDINAIRQRIQITETYKQLSKKNRTVSLFITQVFTKHVPIKEFERALEEEARNSEIDALDPEIVQERKETRLMHRLMHGISIKDGDTIHLLCDDERSLMKYLCNIHLAILRSYDFSLDN